MPEAINDIVTSRLILRLFGNEVTNACLNNQLLTAQDLLQAAIPGEFFEDLCSLQHDCLRLQENPAYAPWASRAIILKSKMRMIGLIRFHNSPDPHAGKPYLKEAAELGYQIFTDHRRNGYARESILGMINWATEYFSVRRFIASVSPENSASLALIQSLSFTKVDEVIDETDGLEYVYMLELNV